MDVEAITASGTWWRQTPHGGDPWFRAEPPPDGRWQRGDVIAALYFADTEETAWAEWYRALAEFAIPPDRQMPRDLWRWDVTCDQVADLSDAARLEALGLELPRPTRRDWSASQELGERLWAEGFRGIMAPSAARPDGRVLCLFREQDEIAGATPIRPALTYRRPPAPPTGMTT